MKALAPVLSALLLLCLGACGRAVVPEAPGPAPSPTPLTRADLQYRLVDGVGAPAYCTSSGPIVRDADPATMVTALRARDPEEFDAIVRHEHLNPDRLSRADDQRVLGQASALSAVQLTPRGPDYDFAYELAGPPTVEVTGTITATGAISVARRSPAPRRLCPLAASVTSG